MFNKLLQRQVEKHLPQILIPEDVFKLLETINGSYERFEQDRKMLERAIELSSSELLEANNSQTNALDELNVLVDRLKEAQEIAHICNFSMDMKTKKSTMSLEFYRIFQCSKNDFPQSVTSLLQYWHPADRILVKEQYIKVLKSHVPVKFESRLQFQDGSIKHIQTHIKSSESINRESAIIFGTFQDITSQKLIQEELENNFDELKKSNLELDKFVYSVSYDLRAPLSSILGVVEIAQDDTEDSIMVESLNMIKTNIQKLDGFITDILDYSRNSRTDVNKEEINFNEVLIGITQNLKYMGGNHRMVDIKINVQEEDCFYSDKSRLNIILNNLVSNSIRYQNNYATNPFVAVDVNTSKEEAVLTIQDNGIGIKAELQSKNFDMFYRVSEDSIGSGLGLYIVKEAVERLNGEIEVESEPGKGTKFTITIPNN